MRDHATHAAATRGMNRVAPRVPLPGVTRILLILSAALMAAVILVPAAETWAQGVMSIEGAGAEVGAPPPAPVAPPTASHPRTYAVWVGYAIMFVLFAAVVLLSLMPSKRGHQD